MECWVLVKIPSIQTHGASHRFPGWLDTGSPLDGELSGNNTDSLTVEGNMFGECQAPCMLKTSFVDFEKKVGTL